MSELAAHTGNVVDFAVTENLSQQERELLNELVLGLRAIRYGSISLTVHDGRLVEIHKTEKIRRKS
jgi:hypothetical protein